MNVVGRLPDQQSGGDPLLRELRIGHLVFRNRVMSTSHACGLEVNGMPLEAYARYHEEKARGGLALTMFGGSSNVAIDSPSIFRQLNVGTDEIIPHLQKLADRVHEQGAYTMCQITHLGRRGDPYAGAWLPTLGPSPVRETLHRSIPKEMDEHDIRRVVDAYADAAARCQEGGLDGIETLASGHLIGQFMSPIMNRRTDSFGGSLENRCRFGLMVHEAIRKATAKQPFVIGMRLTVDEGTDGGLTAEDCIKIGEILKREGAVDFLNAIWGATDTLRSMVAEHMPGMATGIAPWGDAVGSFRNAVGLPVFHATRVTDLSSARYAVAEGKVDMIGMTRAQIADPYLVQKLREKHEEQIRPCVGATHCQSSYRPACLHNPISGRETKLDQVQSRVGVTPRRIVVVGGGPAGLEAARISAERGHTVTLFEAASDLGGQVLLGSRGSWRRDLLGIIEWREAELNRLNVEVRNNCYAEGLDIRECDPDVVILATGGIPFMDIQAGDGLCTSAWDVLAGQVAFARSVLVVDGTGRHVGPLVAEAAKVAGATVKYCSIDATVGEDLVYADRYQWRKRFNELNIEFIGESRLVAVERNQNRLAATLFNDLLAQESTVEIDQVVIEHGTVPLDDIFDQLRAHSSNSGVMDLNAFANGEKQNAGERQGFELYRIGDAVSSRNIQAAMLDAARLCNRI